MTGESDQSKMYELALLSTQAKRYSDTISLYQSYLASNPNSDISPCNRLLLYNAFNHRIINECFHSYSKLTSLHGNNLSISLLKFVETIENEIDSLCLTIVKIIDNYFLASPLNKDQDIIETLRRRGDYLYYQSSIARPGGKCIMLQAALRSYTEGVERSRLTLPINNHERLNVLLRKCSCETQLTGTIHSSYDELIETMNELTVYLNNNNTTDQQLTTIIQQMEIYKQKWENLI